MRKRRNETELRDERLGGPGHINYARDVARCKCNTNWTGPLIIIHWRHLLAYLTVHRRASLPYAFRSTLDFFHALPSSSLSLSLSLLLASGSIEFVVDYYLLNASAKTAAVALRTKLSLLFLEGIGERAEYKFIPDPILRAHRPRPVEFTHVFRHYSKKFSFRVFFSLAAFL